MPKKKSRRPLGVVPRTLLRGAIAGAIPACALTGCTSTTVTLDGSAQPPDGLGFGGVSDHAFFGVDAPAFTPDAAVDATPDAGDAHPDAIDAGKAAPLLGVADVGFRHDDARADAPADLNFFAVDAPAFKG